MITVGGGKSRLSKSSKGASILVITASTKVTKSLARPCSEGITFGIVANRMLSGLGSEPMKPSHSSVTTKVTRMSEFLDRSSLQRLIMGLTWPRPGYGIATTWLAVVGGTSIGSSIETRV